VAVREVNDLKILDETFPGLGNQRQVVQWAFEKDRKVMDAKRFSYNTDSFLIVQLTSSKSEGLASAADVEASVKPLVLNEKKKAYIVDQIKAYTTLEEVGNQFGQTPSTATAMNRFTAMLAGASKEPKIIGAAFSLPSGTLSAPIAGNSGVYVVKATATKPAEALPSYAGYKSSLLNSAQQNLRQELTAALKSTYTIVDNRNLYY
jgi:hypothetical protein